MQSVLVSSHRIVLLSHGRVSPGLQYQSLRFLRKPRWVPIAKSKMYRVIDLPSQPYYEEEEMKLHMQHFKLYNKSLWTFQKRIYEEQEAKSQLHAKDISEEGELERIFLDNESHNAKIKALREAHLKDEWKLVEQQLLEQRRALEDKELIKLDLMERKLEAEIERFQTVIKEEDLDEAIEKALAIEVDYNFCIDKDGKLFKGRHNSDRGEDLSSLVKPITFQAGSSSSTTASS